MSRRISPGRQAILLSPVLLMMAACLPVAGLVTQAQAAGDPSSEQMLQALHPRGITLCPDGRLDCRGVHPDVLAKTTSNAPNGTISPHYTVPSELSPAPGKLNLNVIFANGSAQLTAGAMRLLNGLGSALSDSRVATDHFRIEGHTDTVGSADVNRALSEARARAVVDYLVSQFSIDRSRLEPVGMGPDGLLIPTGPGTPEPRNRRVQVVDLGRG